MPNNGVLLNTRRRRNSPWSLVAIESEEANGSEATVTVTTPVLEGQAVLEGEVEEADRGVLGHTRVPLAASPITIETGRQMGRLLCL